MGIFSKKTDDKKVVAKKTVKKEKAAPKASEPKEVKEKKNTSFDAGRVIRNPRITEKAAHISDNNVYTFDIYKDATKIEIVKAVKAIYNVTPVRVNVVAIPTKRVFRQKHIGVKRGGRKAYVFLKKGDKIEFI